ncbi:PAS domain S-box protein [Methanolobus sp. ZRKC5]|uniref:PAS domain S-box protein n=1 Tax=unclassified Methanolobus TaxID=2629569 RepID=UPI00313EA999
MPSDKPRILVVDDEPLNVELLQAYLKSDYDVLFAYNGYDALDIVSREMPDLVLLDVMMPDISGYSVCERIKSSEITQFIPVVLVTALSARDERLRGIEVNADDFLIKPVDRLELKMRVNSLLRIKALHDNLIRERDQAQNYLDVAAVLMMVLNLEQNVSLINKMGLDILGYANEEEVIGQNLLHYFIPEASKPEMEKHISGTLHKAGSDISYYECPVITKQNEQRIISWYSKSLMDENGHIIGVLCSGMDITTQKKAAEELRIQTRAMEASIDGMAIMDEKGTFTYVNNALVHIFGYDSPDEFIGEKWHVLYNDPEIEIFSNIILSEFSLKGKWKGELLGKKKDGSSFFHEASLTALDKGLISVVRDISERKEVESQLNQYALQLKSSNELKDLFTDMLRHDLLNPAGVIKGFNDMLLQEEVDKSKRYKLQLIEKNVSRLIEMIESAAKLAMLEDINDLAFKYVNLASIIRNVVQDFEPQLMEKNITLDLKLGQSHPAMVNSLIEGVFINFISNAIKYGPSDSVVSVEVQDLADEWKVLVSDLGEGIPDKDKDLVFNRFKRLGEKKKVVKGSGLGLAIAQRIIELHGGKIGISDNPEGKGSVFWATVKKA